ncbi:hypothetical protein E2562_005025 [Oryza meyeriana var. granulata]|uniref:Uncharacterized protein n=1 Tax=Oryza meyeriana var. granulata TaxID=110450 RepID=A0A6G1BU00_9ORYZ|nr:hypothetical protein E2562_005025 [Oryza meyeriana var. granulata]
MSSSAQNKESINGSDRDEKGKGEKGKKPSSSSLAPSAPPPPFVFSDTTSLSSNRGGVGGSGGVSAYISSVAATKHNGPPALPATVAEHDASHPAVLHDTRLRGEYSKMYAPSEETIEVSDAVATKGGRGSKLKEVIAKRMRS